MKVKFWLIDINHEEKDGNPQIWLWGISDAGKRVLVIDESFVAYFYVVIKENVDPSEIVEQIDKEHYPLVVKCVIVERKFFGKPVKATKVYCKNPDVIPKYARAFRNLEGVKDCFEDDIRYSMRYLIDNNVVPCGWHEVEATEAAKPSNIHIDSVYKAESCPKSLEKTDVPKLKILGFSTVFYSREGSPKPETSPVIIISTSTNNGEEKCFLADEDKNDKTLLQEFIAHVRNFDPDIIVGFDTNAHDWPYLTERCRKLEMKLGMDRVGTEPHRSVYGHMSLTGRANLDLSDFVDEFPEVKVKTLENFADYLGILKIEDRTLVEDIDVADYWDDKKKRETLIEFSTENIHSIMGITDAILDFALQLSALVGLPSDHVGTAVVGFRVESFLMKRAQKIGELIPRRIEQPYRSYAGGIVLQPEAGLHENIAVLDFKSMYPNLMITFNLSPDTYVSPKDSVPSDKVYEAPEVKHRFLKDPPGFYKEALSYLIKTRDEIREKMKKIRRESTEYRVLDARQKAVKVLTNASYGYAGWVGARWYMKPVAEAATAWGRQTILETVKTAKKFGLKVVYGDTDSLFVTNEPEKIRKLSKEIHERQGLEISPDKVYTRVFFTEAKKRYAGLLPDGQLDIVGLEVIRGDWAAVAKKVQEKVLEIILKEQSPEKAVEFTQQFISELRQKRVPYRDLIIWKTLTKPVEEYEVKASHVEAAKMLKQKGWKLAAGDKVGYVVVVGTGRLYERIRPYIFASYDDIDVEYYVSKQVVPAAARILESFGITEEQLLSVKKEKKETRKISEFF